MNQLFPAFNWQTVVVEPWTANISSTFWIVLMGSLVAVACGLIGCFLVLRRMALLGDAISHTVLPGIAIAFLLSHSKASLPMFIGAAVFGVLTTMFIEMIHKRSRVKEDAAIGVVFPTLFAIGVILIALLADHVDLDQECVLYGEITFIPLQEAAHWFGMTLGPEPVMVMGVVCLIVLVGIVVFFRPLVVASFDAALATSIGINANVVHYGLMTLLALTVVSAFESVGAILVVSMLITPGATAYLLTDRLPRMLLLAAIHGVLSALLGWHLSVWLEASTAGAMVLVGTFLFAVTFVFSPRHGLVARAVRRIHLARRIDHENVLGVVAKQNERGSPASVSALTASLQLSPFRLRAALRYLRRKGWLAETSDDTLHLTAAGREEAEQIVRAHRLWETLLSREGGLPQDHLHESADYLEHLMDETTVEALSFALGHPEVDPHGGAIPSARR